MRIEEDVKLDFKDVLIRPKRSKLSSRSQVVLDRKFKFLNSGKDFSGVPVIAANMDTVGTFKMADALNKHNMMVALHKHYSAEELIKYFSIERPLAFYSIGTVKTDLEKLDQVYKSVGDNIKNLCVDVANGYTETFVKYLRKIREQYPDLTIMAGNVVTGEMTEELILSGVDIVKIGIGPGCLEGSSRVLMANGTYKNIVDVIPGDKIINMLGQASTVKRKIFSGYKKFCEVAHSNFYKPLLITPEHNCFVGNYKTIKDVSKSGLQKVLSKNTRFDKSKLEWLPVSDLSKTCGLLPKQIQWDLPEDINIGVGENNLQASYDLGYLLGYFLGDGCSSVFQNKKSKRWTRKVTFYFHSNDKDKVTKLTSILKKIANKNCSLYKVPKKNMITMSIFSRVWAEFFQSFGKKTNKHLPISLMCKNKDYNLGLYDGLMESDGQIVEDGRPLGSFTNSSKQLIELFGFLSYEKFGYFANVKNHGDNASRAYVPNSFNTKFVDDYQIVKFKHKKFKAEGEVEIPVYDIEIDDDTHSFIANNMIVHNSVCTTRKMTGVGYPQLSCVIECSDAAHGLKGLVCSDGGITVPGDAAKAFGAGADFIMMGGMFAGHDESDAKVIERDGKKFLQFYGMSSSEAMNKHSGGVAEYRASEGKVVEVPYRGPVDQTCRDILGGVRSACTYVGAASLKELSKRTTFIRVTQQLNEVFGKS